MCSRPPRSHTIVGSAVATIVLSSAASSTTSARPVKASPTGARDSAAAGAAGAAEAALIVGDSTGPAGGTVGRVTAFGGFPPATFAWFAGLEADNSRDWFGRHRDAYDRDVRGAL